MNRRLTLDKLPARVLRELDLETAFYASRLVIAAERLQVFRKLEKGRRTARSLGRSLGIHAHYARRFFDDVLVSTAAERGEIAVHVVSDRTSPIPGQLEAELVDFAGETLWQQSRTLSVVPQASRAELRVPRGAIRGMIWLPVTAMASKKSCPRDGRP